MLSLQYLNKRLKKDHIEKILENYNIKYTTIRKEIDNKINVMMKTITQDLSAFLNNMEDVAAEKEKIKSHEINQNEIETLREQVKDKIHEHTKLKREIEMLKTENTRLKALSNNSNNYQTNTTKKKKPTFSLPSSKENTTQYLNTISNYQSSTVRSSLKKAKDIKSERKEKKDNKDNRLFMSPQANQIRKSQNKISDFTLDDSSNKKKGDLKKKDKKNLLSSYASTETIGEPTKRNTNCYGSTKNIFSKNRKNINTSLKRNTNNNIIFGKKTDKKSNLSHTIDNFNKNKDATTPKSSKKSKFSMPKEKTKEGEDDSTEKENITVYNENNESKSKTTEDNDDEQTFLDDELKEMDDFEEDILSLMEQIKEFNQENTNLT